MISSDLFILQQGVEWLELGYEIKLVTVVKATGATPRPVGSIAIFSSHGQIVGSVSGGCVEEALLESLVFNCTDKAQLIDYSMSQQETFQRGLPCGGQIQLFVEPLFTLAILKQLVEGLRHRKLLEYQHNLVTGKSLVEVVPTVFSFQFVENESITRCFGATWRMLLIGGNELSRQLAQFAVMLDYEIEVCDPRDAYQDAWGFSNISLSQEMPDEFIQRSKLDERTLVITLAHDPRLDDMALIEALSIGCFYIGALGSQQTNQKRRKRLADFVSEAELQHLHGPVGLAIGSRTPAEIAIAILAEVTALRNNKSFF